MEDAMIDHHSQIIELQDRAADCELLGSLSADPELRFESRRRAKELRARARALADAEYQSRAIAGSAASSFARSARQ
jgi:hypothetical protein